MFSGLAYEVPPQTGKKTFGAPSFIYIIQPAKNQASLSAGTTPIR